jgi:hypothetical protein
MRVVWPFRKRVQKQVVPPVDLNTPVTNRALLEAMNKLGAGADKTGLNPLIVGKERGMR